MSKCKLQAVRLVKGEQAVPVTAKIFSMSMQIPERWVRLHEEGQLKGAGDKPVSPERTELVPLRAKLAQLKTERSILKKPRRTLPGNHREVRNWELQSIRPCGWLRWHAKY